MQSGFTRDAFLVLYSLAINNIDADYAKIFPGKATPSEQKQLRGYILGRATTTGYYLGPVVAQDQVMCTCLCLRFTTAKRFCLCVRMCMCLCVSMRVCTFDSIFSDHDHGRDRDRDLDQLRNVRLRCFLRLFVVHVCGSWEGAISIKFSSRFVCVCVCVCPGSLAASQMPNHCMAHTHKVHTCMNTNTTTVVTNIKQRWFERYACTCKCIEA